MSRLVSDKCGIQILNSDDLVFRLVPIKVGKTWDDLVFEERFLCCFFAVRWNRIGPHCM